MENQKTQQSSLHNSQSTRSRRRAEQITSTILLTDIKHWYWLIWGGVWTLLLAIATLAIFSLTNATDEQQLKQAPPKAENQVKTSAPIENIPVWLLGSAALILVGGSLVIVKLYNSPRSRKVLTRRQQRQHLLEEQSSISINEIEQLLSEIAPTSESEQQHGLQQTNYLNPQTESIEQLLSEIAPTSESEQQHGLQQTNYLNPQTEVVTILPLSSQPISSSSELLAEVTLLPPEEQPIDSTSQSLAEVTVLPPEEQPIDLTSQSLAEIMDIRKQRSLSSLLQDTLDGYE